jgi:hypothetical protein
MEYNQILSTIGITQVRLESIIIFTIIAMGIGIVSVMYWKFLLAGFFALVILFVFSRHDGVGVDAVAKTPPVVIENENKFDRKSFIEDCMSLTTRESICEELWTQRSQ